MPAAARGDQGLMHRFGSIVDEYPPRDIGQRAACFVHQKVGRRKVLVVARPPRERDIERALGDAREAQRQGMNFRHRLDSGTTVLSRLAINFRPGSCYLAGCRSAPRLIGFPFGIIVPKPVVYP